MATDDGARVKVGQFLEEAPVYSCKSVHDHPSAKKIRPTAGATIGYSE
jgi:hypothetical protein